MKNKFLGRDREINHLFEAFNYVAQKNTEGLYSGPRIVSIISESGLGKSRLVQELYCRIANTELYNPSAFKYWPKEFNDNDVNLQVTPKMDLQNPQGPPKFLWVGARWPPVNERNQASRDSVFPEIKQDLSIHESIIRKMSPAWLEFWNRTTSVIKADFPGEIRGQVTGDIIKFALDMSVPFSGLISGVIKNTVEMAIDRSQAKEHYTAIKEAKSKDEVEEMLGIFTKLLSDKHAIPIVLWLDDAHWADDLMQSFIHRLVFKAKEKKWPLLVVITHWLREFHLQTITMNPTALSNIIKYSDINDVIELTKIDHTCLVTYVNDRLPGITQSQVDLLCDKCDGNFLSMVENVGLLLSQPRYFNNRDTTSFINDIGIEKISNWESDREKRVQQRFNTLEPMALQDALALGADQGVRFLPELIIKHLENEGIELSDGMTDFDKCIVPFSIITKHDGSSDIREFRDKLYLKVSLDHFGEFHKNDIDANSSISKWDVLVKQWLTHQINDCFDSAGNIIDGADQKLYFINGTQQELNAILALGLNKLDLSCPNDLSLRFTCLLVLAQYKEQAWTAIARDTDYVKAWNDIAADFINVVSESVISNTLDSLMTAGAYYAALPFSLYKCNLIRKNFGQLEELEYQRDLANSLKRLSEIQCVVSNLSEALKYGLENLAIVKKLAEQLDTPESHRDLADALHNISTFKFDLGDYSEGLNYAQECLSIYKKLAEHLETPFNLEALSCCLHNISWLKLKLLDYPEALKYGLESLVIDKKLTEQLDTPSSLRSLVASLYNISIIKHILEDLPEALNYAQECLSITKGLNEKLDTPESQRDLSDIFYHISRIKNDIEDFPEALRYAHESLAIVRKLTQHLDTPSSYQSLAYDLRNLSKIHQVQDNLLEALNYGLESLAVEKKLVEILDVPEIQQNLASSLIDISQIQKDLGNLSEALALRHECLVLQKNIAKKNETPESYQEIAVSLKFLSSIQISLENLSEALSLSIERLAIETKLVEQLGSPENLRELGSCYYYISYITRDLGNLSESFDNGLKCLDIARKITEQLNDVQSYKDEAKTLKYLSQIQINLGNLDQARSIGMECLAIARKLAEQLDTPESHEFVDEIETFINSI
jgi:hypothetical protein